MMKWGTGQWNVRMWQQAPVRDEEFGRGGGGKGRNLIIRMKCRGLSQLNCSRCAYKFQLCVYPIFVFYDGKCSLKLCRRVH